MITCKKCGNTYDESYGVCPKCGSNIAAPQLSTPTARNVQSVAQKNNKGKIITIFSVSAVVLIGIVIALVMLFSQPSAQSQLEEQISLGEKYLSEEKYDEAIVAFKKAIEIEPNDPQLYIQLADAYIGKGDTDSAIETLQKGYEKTGSSDIKTKLDELTNESDEESLHSSENEVLASNVNIVDSGKCGDNVSYTLDENGTLTISGSGEMYDYDALSHVPWYENRNSVNKAVIKNGVTSIGGQAFIGCTSLTSITIPNSVTSIGVSAFNGCTSLTIITIPNSVTSIGMSAFYSCTSLTSITIPNSVTSIEWWAFDSCTSLTSITIPSSVTSIGWWAFDSCTSLTSINVSSSNKNYLSVDGVLFNKNKTELIRYPEGKSNNSYSIPDSVTSIGVGAFYRCSSLTSITIPNSVTSIESRAFEGCDSLTSITIPNSVTSMDGDVFEDWMSSQTIYIQGRSSAPSGWDDDWDSGCDAKIVWNA